MEKLRETRKAYEGECRQKACQGAPINDLVLYLDYFEDSFHQREVLGEERKKNLDSHRSGTAEVDGLIPGKEKYWKSSKNGNSRNILADQEKKERKATDDLVVQRRPGSRKGI